MVICPIFSYKKIQELNSSSSLFKKGLGLFERLKFEIGLSGGVRYCCLNNGFKCLNTTTCIFIILFNPHVFSQYLNNDTRNFLPNKLSIFTIVNRNIITDQSSKIETRSEGLLQLYCHFPPPLSIESYI